MNKLLLGALAASLCVLSVVSCAEEPATTSDRDAVNQLGTRTDALTLADGGTCSVAITPSSELMMRDLAVVENPIRTVWTGSTATSSDGAWTFGRLMTAMAGTNDPAAFVLGWLQQWESPETVNGFVVAPRPNMKSLVTTPWLTASGGAKLDLTKAPFRLLAIVNRMDLQNLAAGSAGEGRFVFGVLDPNGNPTQFTTILEYRLPATTTADVSAWANKWHALSSLAFGSPAYNAALEAITNGFAGKNILPSRPNGSAIDQVRTNEIALAAPWEMREFHLDSTRGGALVEAPVSQTPDLSLDNSAALASWVNANTPALLASTDVVPATFNGAPFLGGSAINNPGLFWNAPGIINNDARFTLSANTCNGCHQGETGTNFLHVAPRARGAVSVLSTFLTGKTQPDPITGVARSFNDLDFRSKSLSNILCAPAAGAPTVAITAPTANAKLTAPTTLTATVTGGVTAVQYFVDNVALGAAVPSPFALSWNPTTVRFGAHSLRAVGTAGTQLVSSASVAFTTTPINAPDFVVTQVVAPLSVTPGEPFTAEVTACNRGNQFGSTPLDLLISADRVFDPTKGDLRVGGTSLSLAPSECSTVAITASASAPGPGTAFFLGAVADLPGVVDELDETNNASPAVVFDIGFGPDFVVTAAHAPASATLGASFTTQVTVCNRGTAGGQTPIAVVLSTDSALTATDPRVGSAQSPFLAVDQCATVAVPGSAFAPGPTPAAFFVGAIANPDNQAPELNSTNDVSPVGTIGVGSAPDFTVTAVTAPPSALPGAAFTSTVTVCNTGTVAGSAPVQLALSKDTVIAPVLTNPGPNDDALVGPPGNVTLNAGACSNVVLQGSAIPPGGAPGPYFVGAVVDPNKLVLELNENNNVRAAGAATGIGSGPDFVIQSVTAPSSVVPGSSFLASVTLCNQGTAPGTTSASLFLSLDSTITVGAPSSPASDRQIGAGPFVSLSPGQCVPQSITGFATPPDGPGPFFLGAVADAAAAVPEIIESNNTRSVSLPIGNAPDFVVTGVTGIGPLAGTTSLTLGAPFQASVTVCNRGTVPGTTDLDLVLSTDATISAPARNAGPGQDTVVTNPTASFTLAPSQCSTQVVAGIAFAPSATPGTFFVAAVADLSNRVVELVETNNTSAAVAATFH